MTDAEIIQGLKARDTQVLTHFFESTKDDVFRLAYRRVRNVEVAEEIVNDVFLRVWQRIPLFSDNHRRANFRAWFNTIIKNLTIDYLRRMQRETPTIDLDQVELGNSQLDPARQLDNLLIKDAILQGSKQTTEQNRQAWRLRYLQGYKPREIAEHLDRPLGTVKIWIHRCNLVLRKTLSEMEMR